MICWCFPVPEERKFREDGYVVMDTGFPGLSGQEFACNAGGAGDSSSIPGPGRSAGEGNGNLLQSSCLENPMDIGTWQAPVHGITRVGHDLVLSFFLL